MATQAKYDLILKINKRWRFYNFVKLKYKNININKGFL